MNYLLPASDLPAKLHPRRYALARQEQCIKIYLRPCEIFMKTGRGREELLTACPPCDTDRPRTNKF